MSKQIESVVKSLQDMTPEELDERIRSIRRNKNIVRPAKQARQKKERKADAKKVLAGLSRDQIRKLLAEGENE